MNEWNHKCRNAFSMEKMPGSFIVIVFLLRLLLTPPHPPPTPFILFLLIFTFCILKYQYSFMIISSCLTIIALYINFPWVPIRPHNGKIMKKCQKKTFFRDKPTNKEVQCADPSHDYWIHFHVFPIIYVAPTLKNLRVWWFQLYASLSVGPQCWSVRP